MICKYIVNILPIYWFSNILYYIIYVLIRNINMNIFFLMKSIFFYCEIKINIFSKPDLYPCFSSISVWRPLWGEGIAAGDDLDESIKCSKSLGEVKIEGGNSNSVISSKLELSSSKSSDSSFSIFYNLWFIGFKLRPTRFSLTIPCQRNTYACQGNTYTCQENTTLYKPMYTKISLFL